jgi:hypothetical protein
MQVGLGAKPEGTAMSNPEIVQRKYAAFGDRDTILESFTGRSSRSGTREFPGGDRHDPSLF